MPIFVGNCSTHGEFEAIMFKREPTVTCPQCGEMCEHLPTAASARFVGSGFYATDYKKEAPKSDTGTAVLKQNKY